MCVGTCVGTSAGTSVGTSVGVSIGVSAGIFVGVFVGTYVDMGVGLWVHVVEKSENMIIVCVTRQIHHDVKLCSYTYHSVMYTDSCTLPHISL